MLLEDVYVVSLQRASFARNCAKSGPFYKNMVCDWERALPSSFWLDGEEIHLGMMEKMVLLSPVKPLAPGWAVGLDVHEYRGIITGQNSSQLFD